MNRLQRTLSILALSTMAAAPLQVANAAMVGTDQIISAQQSQAERAKLQQWLDRDGLQTELALQGIDMDTAKSRIAALTDEEVALMNQKLDQLPAGQGILGIAATIFVVFIITDAIGATDVFTFVNRVR